MGLQVQVNPEMVILAREYRALTQKELADAVGVKQPQIAMIEGGVQCSASAETLDAISAALNFPMSFFTLPEPRLGFGSSSVYYRKMSAISAADRKSISSITNLSRIGLKRLLDAVEIDSDLILPKIDLDDVGGSPGKAAAILRAAWALPDGPVSELTSLVERAGVVIIEVDFGTRGISGTGMRHANMPPLIFVNSSLPPDRYRFTLAHEVAHLVLHDSPRETMEDEADEFASELLMQRNEFIVSTAQFGNRPTLRNLIALKPYWKIAISAMILRLGQLGVISPEYKRSLFIQMSTLKMRLDEPQPFQKERPTLHAKIVRSAIGNIASDTKAATAIMKMPEDVFTRLYASSLRADNQPSSRLRLV
ncbi:MAG: helix-turn-helix domain-containing protein [Acidobacteriaceae bacterium]|jgi:Zn-dependent peptidase ImmA (M78 family)/transcriptional regulator with XRE-family HTH domain